MTEYDSDEVDRRFAQLISDEFGENATLADEGALSVTEPSYRPPDESPEPLNLSEPFNLSEAIEKADPTPEEEAEARYTPTPLPTLHPAGWQLVGWALLGLGIVVGMLVAFEVPLPPPVGMLSAISAVLGLALLLGGLFVGSGRSDPPDDDGARL